MKIRDQVPYYERSGMMGIRSFLEVGAYLQEARDNVLHYPRSWEQYCREDWHLSKSSSYRIMDAFDTVLDIQVAAGRGWKLDNIPTELGASHFEALARLRTPKKKLQAYQLALKLAHGKKLTARLMKKAARIVNCS